MIDDETGEVLLAVQRGAQRRARIERTARAQACNESLKVLFIDNLNVGAYLRETLLGG